jgi:hypothetical protein
VATLEGRQEARETSLRDEVACPSTQGLDRAFFFDGPGEDQDRNIQARLLEDAMADGASKLGSEKSVRMTFQAHRSSIAAAVSTRS